MGNVICSPKETVHRFDTIEHKIRANQINKTSTILQEYRDIKQCLLNKARKEPQECKVSTLLKSLSAFIEIEKRKRQFINWSQFLSLSNNLLIEDIDKSFENNLKEFSINEQSLFSHLLASGPFNRIRSLVWFISTHLTEKDSEVYHYYLSKETSPNLEKQIQKDLHRTFFSFEDFKEEYTTKLYNILKAVANQDAEISYCQGMNFIAKFCLQVTSFNEVKAFNLFSHVLTQVRGFFCDDFPLLNAQVYIFDYFFGKLFPKLKSHFITLDMPSELWISKWIQTLYTICCPFEVTCRIWDSLFSSGYDFIIPLSLTLVSVYEKQLLELNDTADVIAFFKEAFCPESTKVVFKNYSDYIVSIDKVISQAKQLFKSMDSNGINSIKKEFECKFNTNLNSLIKKYDMSSVKILRSYSSQSSTDFSLSHKFSDIKRSFSQLFVEKEEEESMSEVDQCEEYDNEITSTVPNAINDHIMRTFMDKTAA